MAKRLVSFTVPTDLLVEPIIYNLGQQFNLVPNIRRADITENRGWLILELEGGEEDIEAGITWVISKGVRVEPANNETL